MADPMNSYVDAEIQTTLSETRSSEYVEYIMDMDVTRENEENEENEEYAKSERWKEQQQDVAEKLILEKLRYAYVHQDEDGLMTTLQKINENYAAMSGTAEVENATKAHRVLKAARKLRKACEKADIEAIRERIKKIRAERLNVFLVNEIREAKNVIEDIRYEIEKSERPRRQVELDRAAMSELRRYRTPPPGVHRVMRGILVLLGEDVRSTEMWSEIQRLLSPGPASLHRRIVDFDIERVNPSLAAHSKRILEKTDVDKLAKTCPVVYMLYVWAMGVIEELNLDDSTLESTDLSHRKDPLSPRATVRKENPYYRLLNPAPATYRGNQDRQTWRWPDNQEQTSRSPSLDNHHSRRTGFKK